LKTNRIFNKNRKQVRLKSSEQILRIAEAGRIISEIFTEIEKNGLIGYSTWEIDSFIDEYITKKKARAAFKTVENYGYASCISLNEVVVHGQPSKKCKIKPSDVVKIDIGASFKGYFADACKTFTSTECPESMRLVNTCERALMSAISVIVSGKPINIIGQTIEKITQEQGFNVIKNMTGHGVGFSLHEPPTVFNFADAGDDYILQEGLVLAIEPIITSGCGQTQKTDDKWALATIDSKLSAHFEHTIAVTETGAMLLTK
jgi:methionyl aminopeptidase